MKFSIEGERGELARKPEEALAGLVEIAVGDGAIRDEWLSKALASIGATELSVEVSQEPRFQVVADATKEAVAVYDVLTTLMREKIRERLTEAARKAPVDIYVGIVEE